MNGIYTDDRVQVNDLQTFQQQYLLIFANEKFIANSTDKEQVEEVVKDLIQIWNKVEVFVHNKKTENYVFAIKSSTMPVSDIRCIYRFQKEHNRSYELPCFVWELVKEYAGIYKIGTMWWKGKIGIQHWKFNFFYQMLQDRFRTRNTKNNSYTIQKIYKYIKKDFKITKEVMTCLHYYIKLTDQGYDYNYEKTLVCGDTVIILDKNWEHTIKSTSYTQNTNIPLVRSQRDMAEGEGLVFLTVTKVNVCSFWAERHWYSSLTAGDMFNSPYDILAVVCYRVYRNNGYVINHCDIFYTLLPHRTSTKKYQNVLALPLVDGKFNCPKLDSRLEAPLLDFRNDLRWRDNREPPKIKIDLNSKEKVVKQRCFTNSDYWEQFIQFEREFPDRCYYLET